MEISYFRNPRAATLDELQHRGEQPRLKAGRAAGLPVPDLRRAQIGVWALATLRRRTEVLGWETICRGCQTKLTILILGRVR